MRLPRLLLLVTAAVALLLCRPCVTSAESAAVPSKAKIEKFMHACSGGEEELVRKMLKDDPDLARASTDEGETGLHLVAISGKVDIARALLEAGADPNVRTTFDGGLRMHPLSWNVYAGHHEIATLLLDHGARFDDDFDLRAGSDEKVTVLDIAEKLCKGKTGSEQPDHFERTYELLLERGAKKYKDLHPPSKGTAAELREEM